MTQGDKNGEGPKNRVSSGWRRQVELVGLVTMVLILLDVKGK